MTSDVVILGAGLSGLLVANALFRQGLRVAVYESEQRSTSGGAARVAAAMLAPATESVDADPTVVSLGFRSLELWPTILSELSAPVFFQQNGTLVLWHPQDRDQAGLFQSRLSRTSASLDQNEQPIYLDATGIHALEPALEHRFPQAVFLPREGQLDNRGLLEALIETLLESGVPIHWGEARAPEEISARWIIDCRGLGARLQLSTLRGVRGEVLRVQTSEVKLNRPIRLLHPRYPIYIAPKPSGVYVVGATQIEAEDRSAPSVRSALELLSALYTVHPAFGEARILEMGSQCRPALPDNRPRIAWDGNRVISINGLYRHGFMIAPAVVEQALALLAILNQNPMDLNQWLAQQHANFIFEGPPQSAEQHAYIH
jgi:glycine oxidase